MALAKTDEFHAVEMNVQKLKKMANVEGSPLNSFIPKYKAQVRKLMIAQNKLKQTTDAQVNRKTDTLRLDVDDDQWYEYNKEYYKLREMEFRAMHSIPGIANLRERLTKLRNTSEMKDLQEHFQDVTKTDVHQNLVKRQA